MKPRNDSTLPSPRRRWVAGGLIAGLVPALGWLIHDRAARTSELAPRPAATPTLTGRVPTLFIGHGSPMNAVSDNALHPILERLRPADRYPRAILMVSARCG